MKSSPLPARVFPVMTVRHFLASFFLIVFCIFLCNCASPRFEKQWNQSVKTSKTQSTVTGPWTGKWTTKTNGHEGPLRCIVSEIENEPDKLQFWYHAGWAGVFSAPFRVKYDVKKTSSNHFEINGTENLGLFGKFNHEAKMSPSSFNAKYSNKKGDVGSFSLNRPANS